jgi:hypothetical protein
MKITLDISEHLSIFGDCFQGSNDQCGTELLNHDQLLGTRVERNSEDAGKRIISIKISVLSKKI